MKIIEMHISTINTPLNINALCILSGGDAVGEARNAPSTRTNVIANTLPLGWSTSMIWMSLRHRKPFELINGTHENQSNAELPPEFLVSSQPSSSPTGKFVIEHAPMMATTAYSPPMSPDFTAHIKLNQAPETIATRTLEVIARWRVKTRSKSGAVAIAATSPERRSVAPKRPEVKSE